MPSLRNGPVPDRGGGLKSPPIYRISAKRSVKRPSTASQIKIAVSHSEMTNLFCAKALASHYCRAVCIMHYIKEKIRPSVSLRRITILGSSHLVAVTAGC